MKLPQVKILRQFHFFSTKTSLLDKQNQKIYRYLYIKTS